MKPYVSNSPKYLDYIASSMTREEILADENLCHLLNNPYIKDNMETALAWAEAEVGGFEEKFQFIKQFLCNGPELDVDTIMHYRDIILRDEDYSFIAKTYFNDIDVVDDYRINEFGKDTAKTNGNCLLNPCDYLGEMSLNIGMLGDSRNFRTIKNLFGLKAKKAKDEKEAERSAEAEKKENKDKKDSEKKDTEKKGTEKKDTEKKDDKKKDSEKPSTDRKDVNDEIPTGGIRANILTKLPPGIQKGYASMQGNIHHSFSDFIEEVARSGNLIDTVQTGDGNAIRNAEAISTMVKAGIFSRLGDCARIWNELRSINYYDPSQNAQEPVAEEVDGKTVEGKPSNKPNRRTDADTANKGQGLKSDADRLKNARDEMNGTSNTPNMSTEQMKNARDAMRK